MYFDFEDDRPDLSPLIRPLSWREGFLLSIILHLVFILLVVLMPELPSPALREAKVAREAELQRERERNAQRFVFVAPRRDIEAPKPPPRADASDKNRMAQAPERAPNPTNPLPFSRGNSPERVEVPGTAAPQPPAPEPQPRGQDGRDQTSAEGQSGTVSQSGANVLNLPGPGAAASKGSPGAAGRGTGLPGTIADALRNIQRYTQGEVFNNPQGGASGFGPSIQFDTKGVEFGPWIRRFIAQIKRNWFIPYAAMAMKGHVVVTFYVHKDGHITELAVPGPCDVESFNNAAYNALAASNPTQQLPPEYPADRAFFTVTFYYNETPPGQ